MPATASRKPKAVMTDPDSPPPCGPFGVLVWDDGRRRWTYSLTPDGQRLVLDWLAKSKTPLRIAKRCVRGMYSQCRNMGCDDDEIEAALYEGLCEGAARFLPERGFAFNTFLVWWFKRDLGNLIRERQKGVPAASIDAASNTGYGDTFEPTDPRGEKWLHDIDVRDRIALLKRRSGEAGCDRREVAILRHRSNGETLEAIGRRFGVTKERVRQLHNRAVRAVRAAYQIPVEVCDGAVADVVRLAKAGCTAPEIADRLDVPLDNMRRVLRSLANRGEIVYPVETRESIQRRRYWRNKGVKCG